MTATEDGGVTVTTISLENAIARCEAMGDECDVGWNLDDRSRTVIRTVLAELERLREATKNIQRYRLSHGKLRKHQQGEWLRFVDVEACASEWAPEVPTTE